MSGTNSSRRGAAALRRAEIRLVVVVRFRDQVRVALDVRVAALAQVQVQHVLRLPLGVIAAEVAQCELLLKQRRIELHVEQLAHMIDGRLAVLSDREQLGIAPREQHVVVLRQILPDARGEQIAFRTRVDDRRTELAEIGGRSAH